MAIFRATWLVLPPLFLASCLLSRFQVSKDGVAGSAGTPSAGSDNAAAGSADAGHGGKNGGKAGAGFGGSSVGDAGSGDAGGVAQGGSDGGAPSGGSGAGATGGTSGGGTSGGGTSGGGTSGAAGAGPLPPFGPAPVDKTTTVEVGVRNNCAFPIWVHGTTTLAFTPDDQKLLKGDIVWYDAPKQSGGHAEFYGTGPRVALLDAVNLNFLSTNDQLIYSIDYISAMGLPIEVISRGTGADCKRVGCYIPNAQIMTGCPAGLFDGTRCLSAGTFCRNAANSGNALCKALDSQIAYCAANKTGCQGASGDTTAHAYDCSAGSFFGMNPKWCAALNRGTVDTPDSSDISLFYKTAPYNVYSKWIHGACPGIYAFAFDDYPAGAEESGEHACLTGKEIDITLCPAG
jgi:hypothetical protein